MNHYASDVMNSDHYMFVDVCKGIAMLMIIVVHCGQSFPKLNKIVFYGTIYGQMGCQLFLLISSFLLCNTYEKGKLLSLKYYKRKYIKLMCPFLLASIIYLFTFLAEKAYGSFHCFDPMYSFKNIILDYFLLQQFNINGFNSLVPGGWYMGALWLSYLLFPIIIKLYSYIYSKHIKLIDLFPLCFTVIVIVVQSVLLNFGYDKVGNNTFIYFSLLNQIPAIWFGISLYYDFTKPKSAPRDYKGLILFERFICLTALALALFLINKFFSFPLIAYFASFSFYQLCLLVAHLLQINRDKKTISKLLSSIGKKSLGIYLTHFLFVWFIPQHFFQTIKVNQTILFLIYVICCFLITYYVGIAFVKINSMFSKIFLSFVDHEYKK